MFKTMSVLIVSMLFYIVSTSVTGSMNNHLDDALTVAQRIEIFGTNSSVDLPNFEFVTLRRLDGSSHVRQTTTRPQTIKRYEILYKGKAMNFTLRQDLGILSPGCMIHHHPKHRPKILYPCSRSLAECFYTGVSDSHNESWIAASTCWGLKGILSIGGSSLVIAPLRRQQTNGNHVDEMHVVYQYISNKTPSQTAAVDELVAGFDSVHRNSRADVGRTRYVETRVVVDPQVYSFHGKESEEYVQTIFNIASRLFEDKSIGMDMKLVLTEIHIYESYDRFGVSFVPDADKTLDLFCGWIAKNATTETDCTLLLTRLDLRFRKSYTTVGLATPAGMCRTGGNCLLVKDIGPAAGPVIAHEIGHLIGMKHINDTPCVGQKGIMGVGATGPGTFRWTSCSASAAKQFLSTQDADCLFNKPTGQVVSVGYNHSAPLPGSLYPKEKQCQLLNGPLSRVCTDPYRNVCGKLLCRKTVDSPCIVTDSNILDGTDCNNTRTWCMSGKCVSLTARGPVAPVNGAWTKWDREFSPCTRTCGGGVRIKARECSNPPPQYGGKTCVGESLQARLCNMEPCLNDYKTEQCAELARQKNHSGNWTKVEAMGDAGCLFWCQDPVGLMEIRYQRDRSDGRYNDGTECDLGNQSQYGRCVAGKCKSFGCDGIMNSGVVYDRCGVCNGTGSWCDLVTASYSKEDVDHVFTSVVVIPRGSYSVTVTQRNKFCFLSAVVNGKRVFNKREGGHYSGIYTTDGVRIQYTSKPEKITIEGPTAADIDIQVYRLWNTTVYRGVSPQIDYTFYQRSKPGNTYYHWSIQHTACSRSCGLGFRTPSVQCVDLSSNPVDERRCDIGKKPSETRQACNPHYCPPSWLTSHLGPCSKTCGNDGIRKRQVHCGADYNGTVTSYPDMSCASQRKPPMEESCTFVPCPGNWKTGPWSQCSKTCSEGVHKRHVFCVYTNGTRTEEDNCIPSMRPTTATTCSMGPCPNTPYGLACKDNVQVLKGERCKDRYGDDICYGKFIPFAEVNCPRTCEICSSSDAPRCNQTVGVCQTYEGWAAVNCPNICNKDCVDEPQCQTYRTNNGDICHLPSFSNFVQQHCRRMCQLCTPNNECKDNNPKGPCSAYGRASCTNPSYQPYMSAHCAKYCHFC